MSYGQVYIQFQIDSKNGISWNQSESLRDRFSDFFIQKTGDIYKSIRLIESTITLFAPAPKIDLQSLCHIWRAISRFAQAKHRKIECYKDLLRCREEDPSDYSLITQFTDLNFKNCNRAFQRAIQELRAAQMATGIGVELTPLDSFECS